jgi:transcription elongation factor GreA
LLQSCDVEALRGFANLLEAGVDRSVERLFTRVAVELSPEVFRGEERPFWSIEGTWTTRAGLERRRAELVELRDVKIPANAEAIGKAASYGDLSENSEWEAAIEDQRHLTARAMELEEEVRGAELIENAGIPPDTVAPGTRVRYRELDTGREHTVRILGPWDNGDDVISYRSPIARGMLGRHPGESSTVELPTGTLSVQVLEVQPLELE